MFLVGSTFDRLLDKATSNLLLEPDYASTLQICDLIRQNDVQPKHALVAIRKKINSPNPHQAMYALQVLESVVKNCGGVIHDELTSKASCEMLHDLAKSSPHETVRAKVLELIQAWAFAFRNRPKYRALKDMMNIMKAEGHKFPTLRETDAMFSADCAPEWADGDVCHRCRVQFTLMQRKHHCRACGQVFCAQCSQKTTTLPKFGIEKEVRVCDACYDQANSKLGAAATTPAAEGTKTTTATSDDLPQEYLLSSLAQQNQAPPRKTDEELREEEELQLALALSQSEAEAKEKQRSTGASRPAMIRTVSPPPAAAAAAPSHSPQTAEPELDPELARYLNRSYWETRRGVQAVEDDAMMRATSPSAPSTVTSISGGGGRDSVKQRDDDVDMEEFVEALKSQVEIFVNRMKSNSSRGRSISNDTSVQTLFMNITAMHSRLLRHIQAQDDRRLHYEGLQDKLTQNKDARAALDALRDEHQEKVRRQAEEAERQRQLQMAHKLEIMRKKKQEYLQYQRQLALQRIQEQEREMQIRQEQQKQQYNNTNAGGGGGPGGGGAGAYQYYHGGYHPHQAPRPQLMMMPPQTQTSQQNLSMVLPPQPPNMAVLPQQQPQPQPPPNMGVLPQQQPQPQPPSNMGVLPQQQPQPQPPPNMGVLPQQPQPQPPPNMAVLPQQQQQQQPQQPPNMTAVLPQQQQQQQPQQQPPPSSGLTVVLPPPPPPQMHQSQVVQMPQPQHPQHQLPPPNATSTAELISFD